MRLDSKDKKLSDDLPRVSKNSSNNVIMEVVDQNESRRFRISHKEWFSIKEWYCDTSNTTDYYLEFDDGENPYAIVRLDKKISEIKIWELTPSSLLSDNLLGILLSSTPGGIKFKVAFYISLVVWAVFGILALVKGAAVNHELLTQVMKLSSIVFVIFLLLNVECLVIRIVGAVKNKYKAVLVENENTFTTSLAFNFILLCIFAFIGTKGIINLFIKLWEYVGFNF